MKSILKYIAIIAIAAFLSLIAGWHFRKLNSEGLNKLSYASAEWRKDILLEKMKQDHPDLDGNPYFIFNTEIAFLVFFGFTTGSVIALRRMETKKEGKV